jgi:hypothetical protein
VNFVDQVHTDIAQEAQARLIGMVQAVISADIVEVPHRDTVPKARIKTTKSKIL